MNCVIPKLGWIALESPYHNVFSADIADYEVNITELRKPYAEEKQLETAFIYDAYGQFNKT